MEVKELPKNAFFKYYRDKKGLRGIVLAIDNGVLGWALCNKKDKFDKELAIRIAYSRALDNLSKNPDGHFILYEGIPYSLKALFGEQYDRSLVYYKDGY